MPLLDTPDAPMPADPRPGMCGGGGAAAAAAPTAPAGDGGEAAAAAPEPEPEANVLKVKDDPQYKVRCPPHLRAAVASAVAFPTLTCHCCALCCAFFGAPRKVYFKMLNMGVPTGNIKLKMQMEGADPAVLDLDPDAPSPNAGAVAVAE